MKSEPKKKQVGGYLQYSGVAFQMAGIIAISFFFGRWIDQLIGWQHPYIAILLVMVFFGTYMYKLYKELIKPKKNEEHII